MEYNGKPVNRLPICGPFSVSVVTGVHLNDVMDHFKRRYKKAGNWRGRSNVRQCEEVIAHFRCEIEKVASGGSLTKWIERHARIGGTYFVRVGNHFVSIVGRRVHDQHATANVSDHWARNKRVTHAFEISNASYCDEN